MALDLKKNRDGNTAINFKSLRHTVFVCQLLQSRQILFLIDQADLVLEVIAQTFNMGPDIDAGRIQLLVICPIEYEDRIVGRQQPDFRISSQQITFACQRI